MSKYFIQKNGVYSAGIWWMGDDVGVGMTVGVALAEADYDDYHEWGLYEYVEVGLELLNGEWYENTHFTSLPHKEICIFKKDMTKNK